LADTETTIQTLVPETPGDTVAFAQTHTLYRLQLEGLQLMLPGGIGLDVSALLSNGRANYTIFQALAGRCAGLSQHSEGGDSDLASRDGVRYEVKAFADAGLHPRERAKHATVHTAASSTFGPNNHGPRIKKLLDAGKWDEAFEICWETGYAKNEFYLYTNTRDYSVAAPFSYVIIPRDEVVANLSKTDPRVISRATLLGLVQDEVTITELP
jgi:hypothetical protein